MVTRPAKASDIRYAVMLAPCRVVMPGLVPGIHVLLIYVQGQDVDGRDKPGHDDTL
jgi:hypothetical protein